MEQNKISRRNFLRVAGASATAAAMGGLVPAASAAGIKDLWSMDLQILATSDTHGKFDPWDYAANKADASGSVAQQATAIKENRTKTTLVVDAGDTIQANSAELFLNDFAIYFSSRSAFSASCCRRSFLMRFFSLSTRGQGHEKPSFSLHQRVSG